MIMKPKPFNSSVNKLAIHKDSHAIAKFKPQIRIIHVLSPEIINTDVANFRDLVQSLTGQVAATVSSTDHNNNSEVKITGKDRSKGSSSADIRSKKKTVVKDDAVEKIRGGERVTSFFDGLSDFDGFIDELSEFRSFSRRSMFMDHYGFHDDPKI